MEGKETSCVYNITFEGTDKFYIGSASNFKTRVGAHRSELKRNIHHNQIMQRCYAKYGNPIFDIIEEVEFWNCPVFKVLLLSREQHYIDTLNPDINICRDARSPLGRKPNKEAIEKSKETKKKNGGAWGKRNPMYGRKGVNNPKFGRKESQEIRDKKSVSIREVRRSQSPLSVENVLEIRNKYNSNTIKHKQSRNKEYTYNSLADEYNVGRSCICGILTGRTWQDI